MPSRHALMSGISAMNAMSWSQEIVGRRGWTCQVDRSDGGLFRAPGAERLTESVDPSRSDARQLQQVERALQRTDVARASLVHSWLVVRKRLMKKSKGPDGPSETFRKEAVKRYLEKKRMKRFEAEHMEDIVVEPEPMDESPF